MNSLSKLGILLLWCLNLSNIYFWKNFQEFCLKLSFFLHITMKNHRIGLGYSNEESKFKSLCIFTSNYLIWNWTFFNFSNEILVICEKKLVNFRLTNCLNILLVVFSALVFTVEWTKGIWCLIKKSTRLFIQICVAFIPSVMHSLTCGRRARARCTWGQCEQVHLIQSMSH